jgi:hypothetical protein
MGDRFLANTRFVSATTTSKESKAMKHSYATSDPRGWCGDPKRGAALGRPSIHTAPQNFVGKLHVSRVYLDAGGYDSNGTYFGTGTPIYWCASEDGTIDYMLRAWDRDQAKTEILVLYPKARFFR